MGKKEIGLILIFCFIPIFCFVNNFWDSKISDDITNWGAFGDYFGSFFSFLSVCVTIYIAYKLSKIEENRHKEFLKFEREKLTREFRESEYRKINLELQNVWVSITEENTEVSKKIIFNCIVQFRYFVSSNQHLFPFLNDEVMYNLKNSLGEIQKLISNPNDPNKSNIIGDFRNNFDVFNKKLQTFLLENLSD